MTSKSSQVWVKTRMSDKTTASATGSAPIDPMSDTPCDEMCDVFIRGKAGEVLQQIVKEVEKSH